MTFPELLTSALAALEREAPQYAAEMARALGTVTVSITVDGKPVRILASSGAVAADRAGGEASVRIVTQNDTIVSLVEGRCGFVDVVEADRLQAWGMPSDLEAVDVALQRFLGGAVRGSSVQDLWNRYRRTVAHGSRGSDGSQHG